MFDEVRLTRLMLSVEPVARTCWVLAMGAAFLGTGFLGAGLAGVGVEVVAAVELAAGVELVGAIGCGCGVGDAFAWFRDQQNARQGRREFSAGSKTYRRGSLARKNALEPLEEGLHGACGSLNMPILSGMNSSGVSTTQVIYPNWELVKQ